MEWLPPWFVLIVDMPILRGLVSVQTVLGSSSPRTRLKCPLASTLDLQMPERQAIHYSVLHARFRWSKQGTFPSESAATLA
jgi:hypothetical protein